LKPLFSKWETAGVVLILAFLVAFLLSYLLSKMSASFHFADEINALIAAREVHLLGTFYMRDVYVTALWWPAWEQVILRRDFGNATGYKASRHNPRNILATLATYLSYSSDVVFDVSNLQVREKTHPDEYDEPALYHDVAAPSNFHMMSWSDFVYASQQFSCEVHVVSNDEAARGAAGGAVRGAAAGGGGGGGGGGGSDNTVDPLRFLTPSCAHGSCGECHHCFLDSDIKYPSQSAHISDDKKDADN